MSEKDIARRLDDSRRAAQDDLLRVSRRLRGSGCERVKLDPLYKDMQGALHWAVECWLGEPECLGWHDQEARFLRVASAALRERYLHVAGGATRLMEDLQRLLGNDDVEEVVITAPSLVGWRERAMRWLSEAEELAGDLTGSACKVKRIERGALRGAPDALTPCFLLARGGARDVRDERGRYAGTKAGIFHFGENRMAPGSERPGVSPHHGMILPLSLCGSASLREKLVQFAQLVAHPTTDGPASGRLVCASQRRADLQAWLNERGLGCLRLLDKEPISSWVRFEIVPGVFREVLSHCEYVTAVSDRKDISTRILEHAPFRLESHGELLEWDGLNVLLYHGIPPFYLFLANDLAHAPDMFSGTEERRAMFRPPGYAMRFSIPDASVSSSDVDVHYEDEGDGWGTLRITLGEQDIEIFVSDVFGPFPSLHEWLQAIRSNDLPIGFEIDEEGTDKLLIAHAFDTGRLLFAVLDKWDGTEFGAAVVDRDVFLAAFHKELNDFLGDFD